MILLEQSSYVSRVIRNCVIFIAGAAIMHVAERTTPRYFYAERYVQYDMRDCQGEGFSEMIFNQVDKKAANCELLGTSLRCTNIDTTEWFGNYAYEDLWETVRVKKEDCSKTYDKVVLGE